MNVIIFIEEINYTYILLNTFFLSVIFIQGVLNYPKSNNKNIIKIGPAQYTIFICVTLYLNPHYKWDLS